MRNFFVSPLISAHDSDSQDLDLLRLDHHQQSLQVTTAGSGAVLVDNHSVARLDGGKRRCEKDDCESERENAALAH